MLWSIELASFLVFSLLSLVHPQNISKLIIPISTESTTKGYNYQSLDNSITCKFQPNGHDCDGSRSVFPKFYYDIKLEECKTFNMGTCPHNLNGYETLNECYLSCRDIGNHQITETLPIRVFCRLQPDFGYCNGYHPRWYYDLTSRTCRGFSYSGCGGNVNRFLSHQLCTSTCGPLGHSGFE